MRLIHTDTLALHEFFGDQIPKYAILSHTWEDQEVNFQEWQDQSKITKKRGYQKIAAACLQATSGGYRYIWVDTVCIDKTSSAELSEAVNSMFAWYERSSVCYAYLADVSEEPSVMVGEDSQFDHSRWFTRGWTLQELLAPTRVVFFSANWTRIGTRESLCKRIEAITQITGIQGNRHDGDLSNDLKHFRSANVAQKMSWISRRKTTREEDMAYCMLGLFDIHMPLLYGEGSRAFIRLQEEILKISNDHTLFCWTMSENVSEHRWSSALAPSPSAFQDSGGFLETSEEDKRIVSYSMTNFGLSISLRTLRTLQTLQIQPRSRGLVAILDSKTGQGNIVGITLGVDGRVASRQSFPPCPVTINSQLIKDFRLASRELYIRHKPNRGAISVAPNYGESVAPSFMGFDSRQASEVKIDCMVMFRDMEPFEDLKSIPPGLIDPQSGLFTIKSTRHVLFQRPLEISFTLGGYQRTLTYGFLHLRKRPMRICNIFLGSVSYRYKASGEEKEAWCCGILEGMITDDWDSKLNQFVREYIQRLEFRMPKRVHTGIGITIYPSDTTDLIEHDGRRQLIRTIVVVDTLDKL